MWKCIRKENRKGEGEDSLRMSIPMSMAISMCTGTCTRACIFTCTCMRACIFTCTCMRACIFTCTCMRAWIFTCTCMHMDMYNAYVRILDIFKNARPQPCKMQCPRGCSTTRYRIRSTQSTIGNNDIFVRIDQIPGWKESHSKMQTVSYIK